MTNQKIVTSLQQITKLTIDERAKYYIPAKIRDLIPISDNGDKLLTQPQIESLGIICEPFWQDAPTSDLVDEGEALRQYIKTHPQFCLCVRQQTAEHLAKAQKNLPKNWVIVLKAAHRPLKVQQMLFDEMFTLAKQNNPSWTQQKLLGYTRQYVADPTLAAPAHTTGGAIDIVIKNISTGQLINMGSPINADGEQSMVFYDKIPKVAQQNRLTLLNAMLNAGFANLVDEWWHFSYGDPYWAAFYGKKVTPYGRVTKI